MVLISRRPSVGRVTDFDGQVEVFACDKAPARKCLEFDRLPRGPTFVNAWLMERGYVQIITVPPNGNHQELFLTLQSEERRAGAAEVRQR